MSGVTKESIAELILAVIAPINWLIAQAGAFSTFLTIAVNISSIAPCKESATFWPKQFIPLNTRETGPSKADCALRTLGIALLNILNALNIFEATLSNPLFIPPINASESALPIFPTYPFAAFDIIFVTPLISPGRSSMKLSALVTKFIKLVNVFSVLTAKLFNSLDAVIIFNAVVADAASTSGLFDFLYSPLLERYDLERSLEKLFFCKVVQGTAVSGSWPEYKVFISLILSGHGAFVGLSCIRVVKYFICLSSNFSGGAVNNFPNSSVSLITVIL